MKRSKSVYTVHPGLKMIDAAIANLKEKTGKDLKEWTLVLNRSRLATVKEQAAFLKLKHGVTTNYAKFVAEAVLGVDEYDPDALVEAMFAAKINLRPIYNRLLAIGLKLGKDVTVTPCATIVPIRRRHVFAQIKPSTKTRIDIGFALGKTKAKGRLVDTGGLEKGDRLTHKIGVTELAEIDDEVKAWLKKAYDLDA